MLVKNINNVFCKIVLGDVWKVRRKLIQCTFNQRILQNFVDIFQKHSLMLTKKLEKEIDGKEISINRYLSISTFGIIRGKWDCNETGYLNDFFIAMSFTMRSV